MHLVGNYIVDHSDVVGASPIGAAPTTSSCGFNGLGKNNCKTRPETFMFGDWVRLIIENWWYTDNIAHSHIVMSTLIVFVENCHTVAKSSVWCIDLARNGNSRCANEILGCAKCHPWRKSPWKWKNFRVCNELNCPCKIGAQVVG